MTSLKTTVQVCAFSRGHRLTCDVVFLRSPFLSFEVANRYLFRSVRRVHKGAVATYQERWKDNDRTIEATHVADELKERIECSFKGNLFA